MMSSPPAQPDLVEQNEILQGVIQRLSADLQQKVIQCAELDVRLQLTVAALVRAEAAAQAAEAEPAGEADA